MLCYAMVCVVIDKHGATEYYYEHFLEKQILV